MVPSPQHSPASTTVSLPSFRYLSEVAGQSNLQYMRAPSVGSEYIPAPIIRTESSYVSPPESVAASSPTPSASVSPTMPQMVLPIRRAKRQTPSYRVEKNTKSAKRKDYSATAKAQECENNRRIDEAQRPYKEGVQAFSNSYLVPDGSRVNGHHSFPRFDHTHVPREAKRAKSATGSSDPNTRHNVAQTHLRAEKGGSRMVLQRLLVSATGWRGHKLQTVVNAKSSGMLFEEKDLLQASTQLNSLAIIIMQGLFGTEGMQQLGGILDLFEPEDVQPADVVRDPREDDRTYNLKCQAARIQVIEEAHLPLGLKNVRSRDELLHIIDQKLMPIASDYGRVALQQMFFCKPRKGRAMF